MVSDEQLSDLEIRIKADFIKTLRLHQGPRSFVSGPMVDELVETALFHVESMLTQVEDAADQAEDQA